jgi:hypothetical protein
MPDIAPDLAHDSFSAVHLNRKYEGLSISWTSAGPAFPCCAIAIAPGGRLFIASEGIGNRDPRVPGVIEYSRIVSDDNFSEKPHTAFLLFRYAPRP